MPTEKTYRPDLPPIPARIRSLPWCPVRKIPVPWFVAWIDGKPEFRMTDHDKLVDAVRGRKCWICGQPLGKYLAFTIGSMCSINRISAEPPEHRECAEFSAQACPFLTGKQLERRENDLPQGGPAPGVMIRRNPGCCAVWVTLGYTILRVENGILFRIGDPLEISWWAKGRTATREEVQASIDSGYPILLDAALQDGPDAVADLNRHRERAAVLLPAS